MTTEIYDYPGGKAKSKVWKVFGFKKIKEGPPTRDNLDMSRAFCRLCQKSYVNKGIHIVFPSSLFMQYIIIYAPLLTHDTLHG